MSYDPRVIDLSIHGTRIAARISGSGDPIVLLNGLSRPMDSWSFISDALRRRTIITFDAPGVGASATPLVPYSMPMLSDVATRILDVFGIDTADLVGFSFGGALAQQIAADQPSRVNKLVLLSTSCGVGSVPARFGDLARIGLRPSPQWTQHNLLGLAWQIAAISTWSSIPFLGRINAPTLVLCGDRDAAVPPANSRLLAARIRNSHLVTVTAGHDLQRPRPAVVVAGHVMRFLNSAHS